ncbi:hypothetical protein M3484_21840 [Pseudomonas sp. GX19020]|uniref:hypothetical protein n=1 Tax=Pseudomonas sp. GX19020 TaxID=2942277 RepID=UPI0020188D71|nr:hypothetical protein [Pseudomonas sp. GX19020]MCL4069204.1 hypothetical protein [Pseudomonas sp. GX19020]
MTITRRRSLCALRPQDLANDPRNPGMPLETAMFDGHAVNRSATERRAASLGARRTVKKECQAAWLINAIRCTDLTTLAGDDTAARVRRLCAKVRQPLAAHNTKGLGIGDPGLTTGAVCVYPTMVGESPAGICHRPHGKALCRW